MTNSSFAHDRSTTEPEFGALDISPTFVAEMLLKRRRVRRSLTEWCRHCGFEPAAHHRLLIDRLERVARGKIKRLAVFMPPGSAKSTYGSILFPPYVMANAPKRAILAASHTTELAEKWGRRIRNLIAGHSATLGVRLSDDSPHAEARMRFRNYYICPCGTEWSDVRSATCDDRCPSCDRSCFSRRERGLICRHGRNLAGRIER